MEAQHVRAWTEDGSLSNADTAADDSFMALVEAAASSEASIWLWFLVALTIRFSPCWSMSVSLSVCSDKWVLNVGSSKDMEGRTTVLLVVVVADDDIVVGGTVSLLVADDVVSSSRRCRS
jgi:hypothetical protein